MPGAGYSSPPDYGVQGDMPSFAGQQYLNDPMANVAMQYGQNLAGQGKDFLHKNVSILLCFVFSIFIHPPILVSRGVTIPNLTIRYVS